MGLSTDPALEHLSFHLQSDWDKGLPLDILDAAKRSCIIGYAYD